MRTHGEIVPSIPRLDEFLASVGYRCIRPVPGFNVTAFRPSIGKRLLITNTLDKRISADAITHGEEHLIVVT